MSDWYRLVHRPSGQTLARITRADGWWAKGWGVLGRRRLPAGEGLWLPDVAAVHTCFVRFPLDLLFLDADLRAVQIRRHVPPWRPVVRAAGARHTIELGAGTLGPALREGELWELRKGA